jgi:hypothetical protein
MSMDVSRVTPFHAFPRVLSLVIIVSRSDMVVHELCDTPSSSHRSCTGFSGHEVVEMLEDELSTYRLMSIM